MIRCRGCRQLLASVILVVAVIANDSHATDWHSSAHHHAAARRLQQAAKLVSGASNKGVMSARVWPLPSGYTWDYADAVNMATPSSITCKIDLPECGGAQQCSHIISAQCCADNCTAACSGWWAAAWCSSGPQWKQVGGSTSSRCILGGSCRYESTG